MMMRTTWINRTLLCLPLVGAFAATPSVTAAAPEKAPICEESVIKSAKQFLGCVTLERVRYHQKQLQEIADRNGGIRVSGTPGYDESVKYVADLMTNVGYDVEVQPFEFVSYTQLGPSTLEQTAPTPTTYVEFTDDPDVDYILMTGSGAGDVTAPVAAVDLMLGPDNASTSGCEPEDFAGFPAGSIALIQRGACTFQLKAENALAAGAVGVIIFNQGNSDDRTGLILGSLGEYAGTAPVMFATYTLGEEWAATAGLQMRMFTDTSRETVTTFNVIAETPGGFDDNVVMVGAHLDSVDEGPGIQDNGSGSAAILEVAVQLAKVRNNNKVRFAWWGAEESGLIGSDFYVNNLSEDELNDIALYLNFDMIGSPNYARFIYDGDGSSFGLEGPQGSAAIEKFFELWYERAGKAYEATEISFRSDYAAFFDNGIPFGGLFTGAEGIKTPEQVLLYGGTAGEQFDPCYHAACDTFDNISLEVLDLNTDAVAAATYWYSLGTGLVNGVTPGNRDNPEPVAAPQTSSVGYVSENRGPFKIR